MNTKDKKKNILDLQFQKNLALASTSLIIFFTYLVGITIAILTKEIDWTNIISMIFLAIISSVVVSVCFIFFMRARALHKN